MRKFFITSLTIISTSIIFSCSSSNDDNTASTAFPHQGKWSGTYSGQKDHGTFKINVSSTGEVTGVSTSEVFQENFDVKGKVSESGSFSAIAGTAESGAKFTGQMEGKSASGTWVNNSAGMNGAWSSNKD